MVLTSRGNLFVAPVDGGRRRHVARFDGVRHRSAMFDEAGKHVIALADHTGEFEFWKYPADGAPDKVQLTDNGDVLRWSGSLSHDGKYLAFSDKNWRLWLHSIETGETVQIFESKFDDIGSIHWAPDSQWLAFGATVGNQNQRLFAYHVDRNETIPLTSERVNSYAPTWHPDGEWLYFLSDRHLVSEVGSPWGLRQPDPHIDSPTKVYALALRPGLRFPFADDTELDNQESDDKKDERPEAGGETEDTNDTEREDEEASDDDASKEDDAVRVEIVSDGLEDRLYVVPVPPGRYRGLSVARKHLYWLSINDGTDLMCIALEPDAERKEIVGGVASFQLSGNAKRILVQKNSAIYVFDANGKRPELSDSQVDLRGWRFPIDTRKEWQQMYVDAWRMERDYFYDRGMHGVDWTAQRDKFLSAGGQGPRSRRVKRRYAPVGWRIGSAAHLRVRRRPSGRRCGYCFRFSRRAIEPR